MQNPNTEAQKGDILWSDNNLNKSRRRAHYIVFIKPYDSHYFVGAMITHSKGFNNIELAEKHFQKTDAKGIIFKVYFDNSLVVGNPLLKNSTGDLSKRSANLVKKE